jgi:hypothetical protein
MISADLFLICLIREAFLFLAVGRFVLFGFGFWGGC